MTIVSEPATAVPRTRRGPGTPLGLRRPVALLFPGQGAQQVRMAAGLYRHNAVFTDVMDTAFSLFGPEGARIRAGWLAEQADDMFDDVTVAQPLLYAVNCALGRMVLGWGLRPAALLGHSVGEMAAATLAGVFGLDDGVRLMRDRVEAFAGSAPGGMLAVAASAAEVEPYLSGDVVVGAINAGRQVMLAGPAGPLAEAGARLREAEFTCVPVKARQGFHSPMLAEAAMASTRVWAETELRPPEITLYSAYRTAVLTAEVARDVEFWAGQPAAPVHFGPTLDALLDDGDWLLLEVGPGQGLSTLARRHPAVRAGRSGIIPLSPARAPGGAADRQAALKAANRIWLEGHQLDWAAVRG
ncbi:acyltransferase domain-containing protein [Amycolatopsis nigrescens]|uniref:acyltransferase domain-containing protein n=1 Tax=Amycolatopsis nigrescens TaxID=381445 RepID=UPI00036D02CC|nr:acyltransferase domain-containing protein [Amycolatopsis nigrescens]